jgi:DNA-binding transcriptional MerR regulator/methylmalonyl-CoA mutase cobalamin-binding subunit
MDEVQHSIKVAARRSGLSTHVIRVWEKRYDAVSPERTDTNRRLYSEEEIERLTLLRMATVAGHSIGNIARLPLEKLRSLIGKVTAETTTTKRDARTAEEAIQRALESVRAMDAGALENALKQAAVTHGQHGLLQAVIAPLATQVGDLWLNGEITAAHEHFASAVIRGFLMRNARSYAAGTAMPTIVVTTPPGQLHEIGAVMVAAAAADVGWRVIYLGPSLPAAEIAGAALQNEARAVALSIVFPADDPHLADELTRLRQLLPASTKIIVGGRAAVSYAKTIKELNLWETKSLGDLYPLLEELRTPELAT